MLCLARAFLSSILMTLLALLSLLKQELENDTAVHDVPLGFV